MSEDDKTKRLPSLFEVSLEGSGDPLLERAARFVTDTHIRPDIGSVDEADHVFIPVPNPRRPESSDWMPDDFDLTMEEEKALAELRMSQALQEWGELSEEEQTKVLERWGMVLDTLPEGTSSRRRHVVALLLEKGLLTFQRGS